MRTFHTLLVLTATAGALRGVPQSLESLYVPDKDGNFHCFNSSKVIPFSKVNDDYCDCPDGSDEPGTSACDSGRFYCENEGFVGHYIPSSWVDDGKCDYEFCCDGSDERPGVCANRCREFQEKYDKERKASNERVRKGIAVRDRVRRESERMRANEKTEVKKYEQQVADLETQLEALKEKRKAAGARGLAQVDEAFRPFAERLEETKKKMEESQKQLAESRKKVGELEQILKQMAQNYNHNFNDPAVKLAAQSYQDYEASKEASEAESVDFDFDSLQSEFTQCAQKMAETIGQQEPPSFWSKVTKISAKDLTDAFLGVKSRPKEDTVESDISLSLLDKDIGDTEKKLKETRDELDRKKEDLNKNYGPSDLLRSKSSCAANQIAGYTYRMCFTGRLDQIDASGHTVRIGTFSEAGVEDKKLVVKYGSGEKCWNGPIRSAQVRVGCGLADEVLSVSEPEKCVYVIEAVSPVGCMESQLY